MPDDRFPDETYASPLMRFRRLVELFCFDRSYKRPIFVRDFLQTLSSDDKQRLDDELHGKGFGPSTTAAMLARYAESLELVARGG